MNNENINLICNPFYVDGEKKCFKGFTFQNPLNNKKLELSVSECKIEIIFYNSNGRIIKNISNFFSENNDIDYNLNEIRKNMERKENKTERNNLISFYNLIKSVRNIYPNISKFSSLLEHIQEVFYYNNLGKYPNIIRLLMDNFYYPIDDFIKYFNIKSYLKSHSFFLRKFLKSEDINSYKHFMDFLLFLINNYYKKIINNENENFLEYQFYIELFSVFNYFEEQKENSFSKKFIINYLNIIKENFNHEEMKDKMFLYYERYIRIFQMIIKHKITLKEDEINLIIELLIKLELFNNLPYFNSNFISSKIRFYNLDEDEIIKIFNDRFIEIFKNSKNEIISFNINNLFTINDILIEIINEKIIENCKDDYSKKIVYNNIFNEKNINDLYLNSVYNSNIKIDFSLNLIKRKKNIDNIIKIINEKFNYNFEFQENNLFFNKRDNILKYNNSVLNYSNILYLIQILVTDNSNNKKYIVEINLDNIVKPIIHYGSLRISDIIPTINFNEKDFICPSIRIYNYNEKENSTKEIFDINHSSGCYYSNNSFKDYFSNEEIFSANLIRSLLLFLSYYDLIMEDKEKSDYLFEEILK